MDNIEFRWLDTQPNAVLQYRIRRLREHHSPLTVSNTPEVYQSYTWTDWQTVPVVSVKERNES